MRGEVIWDGKSAGGFCADGIRIAESPTEFILNQHSR